MHTPNIHGTAKKTLVLLALVSTVFRQAAAQDASLSVDEAVQRALASDSRVESTLMDLTASRAKIDEAQRGRIPSVSLSAGYTRLSDVQSTVSFGSTDFVLDSQDDVFSLTANMQYPVFAGFRLRESIQLAQLQAMSREIASAMTRRAVIFETRRAYWEAVRSNYNVTMLRENRALMQRNRDVTEQKYSQGTVLKADLLAAEMRCDQAEMDLGDAIATRQQALLYLKSLVSPSDQGLSAASGQLELTSKPEDTVLSPRAAEALAEPIDDTALIRSALTERPETRAADLAVEIAGKSRDLAQAPLYPTLTVSGNYTYANPNSRVAFQSEPRFTGTWNLGIALSYDIGGVPADLSAVEAEKAGVKKNQAERDRQAELVILDVQKCLLSYKQARKDIALVSRMLDQATENERVTTQRVKTGMASDLDQLKASIARLRSEFAIVNRQINLQIAAADLCRAAALTDISQ